jgi:hypothetical protein
MTDDISKPDVMICESEGRGIKYLKDGLLIVQQNPVRFRYDDIQRMWYEQSGSWCILYGLIDTRNKELCWSNDKFYDVAQATISKWNKYITRQPNSDRIDKVEYRLMKIEQTLKVLEQSVTEMKNMMLYAPPSTGTGGIGYIEAKADFEINSQVNQ